MVALHEDQRVDDRTCSPSSLNPRRRAHSLTRLPPKSHLHLEALVTSTRARLSLSSRPLAAWLTLTRPCDMFDDEATPQKTRLPFLLSSTRGHRPDQPTLVPVDATPSRRSRTITARPLSLVIPVLTRRRLQLVLPTAMPRHPPLTLPHHQLDQRYHTVTVPLNSSRASTSVLKSQCINGPPGPTRLARGY